MKKKTPTWIKNEKTATRVQTFDKLRPNVKETIKVWTKKL